MLWGPRQEGGRIGQPDLLQVAVEPGIVVVLRRQGGADQQKPEGQPDEHHGRSAHARQYVHGVPQCQESAAPLPAAKLPERGRVYRRVKVRSTCLLLAIFLLCPASAAVAARELDRGFGQGGKVCTPLRFGTPWSRVNVRVAAAPDGGLVTAVGEEVAVYEASGTLDPQF